MQARHFIQPIMAEAVHIDSVRLSHAYLARALPSPQDLSNAGFDLTYKNRKGSDIVTAHRNSNSQVPNEPYVMVIRNSNIFGYSGVSVECSLTKLVNGNGLGIQEDEDIECGLDAIEDFLRGRVGIQFDSRTAKVGRFDVNADFRVGEDRIPLYVNMLSRPSGRYRPSIVGTTTKYFTNKSTGYAIYGKKAEMEHQVKKRKATMDDVVAAEGILRLEKRFYRPQPIRRFAKRLNLNPQADQLLTKAVAMQFIREALSETRLDEFKYSNEARKYELLNHFPKKAAEMLGILEYCVLLGEDCWDKLGCNKQTLERKKKALKNAELWDVSPAEALPALAVP
jgi:hypothetical protein